MDHKTRRLNDDIVKFVKAPTHPLLTVHSYHSASSIFHLHFTELRIWTAMYFYCLSREALPLPNNQRTSHSNLIPVTSCGNCETAFSSLQSDTPQPPFQTPSIFTLFITVYDFTHSTSRCRPQDVRVIYVESERTPCGNHWLSSRY